MNCDFVFESASSCNQKWNGWVLIRDNEGVNADDNKVKNIKEPLYQAREKNCAYFRGVLRIIDDI